MKKLLIINVSANTGSTGRIAEGIGKLAKDNGYEPFFAYGRKCLNSSSNLIRIGNDFDIKMHGISSLLFDNHGFGSKNATKEFIKQIDKIKPDIINLHNIHGYYLNVEILFSYLKKIKVPIVWTFHDCWPFTGHCSYFDRYHCEKWKIGCNNCPNIKGYPKSIFLDRSYRNYNKKKHIFREITNDTVLVAPCLWMKENIEQSFLADYPIRVINNGIDLNAFKPIIDQQVRDKLNIPMHNKVILGVASIWDERKGLKDFMALRERLNENYTILLVGLNKKQVSSIPNGIIPIERTESVEELAKIYSMANIFVNPTYIDNFPTTNLEALACGTPVITYKTGGSPDAIDENTGIVVPQGDINQLEISVRNAIDNNIFSSDNCRFRAEYLFSRDDRFYDYIKLFDELTNKN